MAFINNPGAGPSVGIPCIWTPPTAQSLPLDAVPGVWAAAYGIQALTTAWLSGNLFDVVVGSNTTTIKALSSNYGYVDLISLQAAIGTGVGYVSKWYDQSGNGHDATQTTAANRMQVQVINDEVFLLSDGYITSLDNSVFKTLVLPAGAALGSQNASCFFVAHLANVNCSPTQGTPGINCFVEMASGGPFCLAGGLNTSLAQGTPNIYYYEDVGFTNSTAGIYPLSNLSVFGMTATAGGVTFAMNEIAGTGSAVTSHAGSAGDIAYSTSIGAQAGGLYGRLYAVLLGTALSAGQQTTIRNSLYQWFGVYSGGHEANLLWDGASITAGVGSTQDTNYSASWVAGYGYVDQTMDALAGTVGQVRWANTAVPGASNAQLTTLAPTVQVPFFTGSSGNRIVCQWDGAGNSIFQGGTAASAYADLKSYVSNWNGSSVPPTYIFVQTLQKTPNAANNAAFAAYNALLLSGGSAALGANVTIINVGADPNIGTGSQATFPGTYFNTDGHPTIAGHAVIASYWIPALKAVL